MRWTRRTTSTSASTSAGGRPRTPSSRARAAQFAEHGAGLVLAEGRHAHGGVAQHLHEHPAEPDRHRRPEQLVLGDADDHLDAPLDHLADQDAVQVDALVAGDVGQLAVGVADLAGRGQPDLDQAEFGLVGELGRRTPSSRPGSRPAPPRARPPPRWSPAARAVRGCRTPAAAASPRARSAAGPGASVPAPCGRRARGCAAPRRRGSGSRGVKRWWSEVGAHGGDAVARTCGRWRRGRSRAGSRGRPPRCRPAIPTPRTPACPCARPRPPGPARAGRSSAGRGR